jgi:hypothetical protein
MASEPLKSLLEKAHNCTLGLPEFQRDFVWKNSQVIKLIASLLNGYPIGGLLFMDDEKAYGFRPLDGVPERDQSKERILVLDGQQRLTSCYQAFYGSLEAKDNPGRFYFKYREYLENTDVTGSEVENLIEFVRKKKVENTLTTVAEEHAAGLFPLDIIFRSRAQVNSYKWLSDFAFSEAKGDSEKFGSFSQSQAKFIQTFVERITGYQIQHEDIPKGTSPDVICTVFETINTTGKKLTVFDLLVARCYCGNLFLRDLLDNAVKRPLIQQFDPTGEELCTVALPRIICLLSKGSCKRGDLLKLDANDIGSHWDKAVDAMEEALRVMVQRFGAFSLRFIPLVDIVAPMAVILSDTKYQKAGRKAESFLSKWYWRSVFSQYFVTSGESRSARAVKEWLGSAGGEKGWLDDEKNEPESVKQFNLNANLLQGVARQDDAVYRGVMCLLLARGVRDLKSPQLQVLTQAEVHHFEDHHIFPQKFLRPHGIKGVEANRIANRTPILDKTNRQISNNAPHQYLNDPSVVGAAGLPADVLAGHHIPGWVATEGTFSKELYNRFISERQAKLLKEIGQLVEAQPVADEDQ